MTRSKIVSDKQPEARQIPFYQPSITEREIRAVVQTLRSGWLTTGPKTKKFEKRFARYVGAKHAVALNSCTAGLHLALVASGVGPGDEVIVPTYTFAASAETVIHAGAKPVLVDSESDTLNLSVAEVEKEISPRTKAVVAVDIAGLPCDYAALQPVVKKQGIHLIDDAAHALGASYDGRMVGTLADLTAFSFYATKNLTTGEGGMVTTDNQELAEKISLLSLHGMSRDAWKRYRTGGSWYYELLDAGFKYNFTDLQAALGLPQLARLRTLQAQRRALATLYDRELGDLPEVRLPAQKKGRVHAWHLYIIRLRLEQLKIDRNQFIHELTRRRIGTAVHFIPLHLHPYYRERYGYQPEDFPVAHDNYQRAITLPLYPRMTRAMVCYVAGAVREIVQKYRHRGRG